MGNSNLKTEEIEHEKIRKKMYETSRHLTSTLPPPNM